VKIKVEDGDINGVTVVLRNLTSGENNEIPGQQRMDLELRLDNNYIISFTKQGYITKRIAFDTRMPIDRSKQELYPFNFEVILFPQYEGLNVVVFNQPVAKIFFDPLLDDFDYDTDYTKQIQSALKKAEEELVQRQKEEHKLAEEKKKMEQQQLAIEEKQKKEEERKNREEEKRLKAENDKKVAEERKLQKIEEEKRRVESKASQGEDNRSTGAKIGQEDGPKSPVVASGNDSRNSIAGNVGVDSQNGSIAIGDGMSSRNSASSATGSEVREGAVQEGAGSEKLIQELDSGNGKDARLIEKASETQGSESKKEGKRDDLSGSVSSKDIAANKIISSSTPLRSDMIVEEYQENGKRVTKVSFSNDRFGKVFMKVMYDWGGVYYFESGRYISQAYFFSVTNIR
jgi:flagellar biosynthesis GTPase FlhF